MSEPLTDEQVKRIDDLQPDSLWRIVEGSWLAVKRSDRGTWIEIIDPEATALHAFDFPGS